jgi:Bacterial protein of unknown function (DUF922)
MFIKRRFTIFAIGLFHITTAFSQSPHQFSPDTMIWREDYLLKFSDFHGKVTGHVPAATFSGISLYEKEKNGTLTFFVEALFIRSKSFMDDSSANLLKHEQLHFDISELYARKLRQKISQIDFKTVDRIDRETENLYRSYATALNEMQEQYDKNTEHGKNPARQQVWIDDIRNQLKALDAFKSTEVDIVHNR